MTQRNFGPPIDKTTGFLQGWPLVGIATVAILAGIPAALIVSAALILRIAARVARSRVAQPVVASS